MQIRTTALIVLNTDRSVTEASTSEFVQTPKQARSQRTLERISRAALELIAEQGVEATTVSQIVRRANSSVGSFYARFSGKDDLVHHLEERVWADAQARWDAALATNVWEDLSLSEIVEGVVRLILQVEQVAGKARRALVLSRSNELESPPPHRLFSAHLESGVGTLLLTKRDQIGHPRPDEAVIIGYRTMAAAAREFVVPEGPSDVQAQDVETSGTDWEALGSELSMMFMFYLGTVPSSHDRPSEDVDFFEIWG